MNDFVNVNSCCKINTLVIRKEIGADTAANGPNVGEDLTTFEHFAKSRSWRCCTCCCSRSHLALLGLLHRRRVCVLAAGRGRGRRRIRRLPVGDEGRRGSQSLLLLRCQRALPVRLCRFTFAVLSRVYDSDGRVRAGCLTAQYLT